MIEIQFPDGNYRTFAQGISALEVAMSLSQTLARNILVTQFNEQLIDLNTKLETNGKIQFYTWEDELGKNTFWHSSAHLLAEAIQFYYPEAQFTIGPPVAQGFYYDIQFKDQHFSENDFSKIEQKMLELAREKQNFVRKNVSKQEALAYYQAKKNTYKLELIENLQDGEISFYTQGNFTDLCKGPHIPHTGLIKAVKILNTAGAYWRGNEKNDQLTRIYAISFPQQKELEQFLHLLEEAKKRDHRKLGKQLELFTFSQKVGQGLPLWLPKGTLLREKLENFLRTAQRQRGYQMVVTPHIGNKDLYVCSGHYDKYGADSFQPIHTPAEGEVFLLKPMNCPHHCEIYATRPRSYRELPLRLAEFGTVYRYEQSGELHGLTRVRGFTQDDAHIFCTPDQVKEEFKKVIDLVLYVFGNLGFEDYTAQISLRDPKQPEKYIGTQENWEKAERAIIEAASEKGLKTVIAHGEAAFYGPKLDFMVKDALKRSWQLGTIQVDYNLPERFQLEYINSEGEKNRPVMIHRAPFGSMERFIAVLLEHCGGDFPLWLHPSPMIILPISEKYQAYCEKLKTQLEAQGYGVQLDERNEKIGKKIRDAEIQKIPLMLIIGEQEAKEEKISIRKHKEGDLGTKSLQNLLDFLAQEMHLKNSSEV